MQPLMHMQKTRRLARHGKGGSRDGDHLGQELDIVGDNHEGVLPGLQVIVEEEDSIKVQVIRGLVQQ